MHWLGLYGMEYIMMKGEVKFSKLNGEEMEGLVHGI